MSLKLWRAVTQLRVVVELLADRDERLRALQGVLAERDAELGSIKATLPYRVYDGLRSGVRFAAGRIRGRKP